MPSPRFDGPCSPPSPYPRDSPPDCWESAAESWFPLQRRFLHISIRTAIANSAGIIVATSLVGALAKNYAVMSTAENSGEPLLLASVLIPTAVAGSLVGSRLTHHVPVRFVKVAFNLLLLLAAVRLTQGAITSLP